jgi:dihydropteroate synthase
VNITVKGKLISMESPLVMGIINLTDDSFYSGSRANDLKTAEEKIVNMLNDGADIIDIGAMSSRPGSKIISPEVEWDKLKPILQIIKTKYSDKIFSLDTVHSEIAKKAVNDFGIDIINDISSGTIDDNMFNTIAELKVPYIIMHMRGQPENMQNFTEYNSIITDITYFFSEKMSKLNALGVNDIIIDPGFGFSKTIEQNYILLNNLDKFSIFGLPILAGLSRKSMIWKTLGTSPELSLNGTTALNMIAINKSANIIRVHDVKEAKEVVTIYKSLMKN